MKFITKNNWNAFVPISFFPGCGGEFFAHLLFYRHQLFDINNFPFNKAGKFSFVNEEKPLVWNSDKNLFGWYMKSHYYNTKADHDQLIKNLGLGDTLYEFGLNEDAFNELSFRIACFCNDHGGSIKMDVNDPYFIDYLKSVNINRILTYDDYQFAVVHPLFRWFILPGQFDNDKYPYFKKAKAIQLTSDSSKGWLFFLLVFNKMYHYYVEYAKVETHRKNYFANLKENMIKSVDEKYNKFHCFPFKRNDHNLNIDSFDLYFDKVDHSSILSEYLEEDFKISKEAIDYYYDINCAIINHYDLDPEDHFVNGQTVYDRFMKYGPLHFEGKE